MRTFDSGVLVFCARSNFRRTLPGEGIAFVDAVGKYFYGQRAGNSLNNLSTAEQLIFFEAEVDRSDAAK